MGLFTRVSRIGKEHTGLVSTRKTGLVKSICKSIQDWSRVGTSIIVYMEEQADIVELSGIQKQCHAMLDLSPWNFLSTN